MPPACQLPFLVSRDTSPQSSCMLTHHVVSLNQALRLSLEQCVPLHLSSCVASWPAIDAWTWDDSLARMRHLAATAELEVRCLRWLQVVVRHQPAANKGLQGYRRPRARRHCQLLALRQAFQRAALRGRLLALLHGSLTPEPCSTRTVLVPLLTLLRTPSGVQVLVADSPVFRGDFETRVFTTVQLGELIAQQVCTVTTAPITAPISTFRDCGQGLATCRASAHQLRLPACR